jgi:hypothetical protein
MEFVLELIGELLTNEIVLSGLSLILLTLIGVVIRKYSWSKHIANLAISAYEYAEEQGVLQELKGYEKFSPFMNKFIEQYKTKYGKLPTASAKGKAVKVMEQLVEKEPGKPSAA